MDKKIAGLVGAVSALVVPEGLQAMPASVPDAKAILRVESYAELLDPIPNALELLKAVDAEAASSESQPVQLVQYYHHHHHHHHGYWGGPYYHHHHHHGYYYNPYPYPYPYPYYRY